MAHPLYAPQQGRSEEKDEYRDSLEEYIWNVLRTERRIQAGDMKAHCGENCDDFKVDDGGGFGRRNVVGERMFELAEAGDVLVVNTLFKKKKTT